MHTYLHTITELYIHIQKPNIQRHRHTGIHTRNNNVSLFPPLQMGIVLRMSIVDVVVVLVRAFSPQSPQFQLNHIFDVFSLIMRISGGKFFVQPPPPRARWGKNGLFGVIFVPAPRDSSLQYHNGSMGHSRDGIFCLPKIGPFQPPWARWGRNGRIRKLFRNAPRGPSFAENLLLC